MEQTIQETRLTAEDVTSTYAFGPDLKAEPVFDMEKAQAFGMQMVGTLNAAATALMVSIGHRTGLFDTMDGMGFASTQEIADAAGLSERYVREWLGTMTVSGIVEHREADNRYRLPDEHAACLTRRAAPGNVGPVFGFISVLGEAEPAVVRAFKHGKGVPYSAYPRFHEVMAEESAQTVAGMLVEAILPIVPGLTERLQQGIDVVDVGCGAGLALIRMAKEFPNSRFTGLDLSEEAVGVGRREAEKAGLTNVTFEAVDVTNLRRPEAYDLVTTFDAVHDQARPDLVLANIHEMLRPGGTYLMQDIGASSHVHQNINHPVGSFLYTVSCMHCMSVSLAGGGMGLGAVWGQELALSMLDEAGFKDVRIERLEHDIANNYYVMQK